MKELTKNGNETNNLYELRGYLYSFVITLFIGVLVGSLTEPGMTSDQRWESLGFWVVRIAIGYFANIAVLLLLLAINKIPTEKTAIGYLPAMIAGAIVTTLVMFMMTLGYYHNLESVLLLVANVVALSLIVQVFLFQSICYDLLSEKQGEKLYQKLVAASKDPKANFILLEVSKEETLEITHAELVMVVINDHYLTYSYCKGSKVKEVTLYGSLKEAEDQLIGKMIKVNRSTLVNPLKIKQLKEGEKGQLTLEGIKEPLTIPESRLKDIKLLLKK